MTFQQSIKLCLIVTGLTVAGAQGLHAAEPAKSPTMTNTGTPIINILANGLAAENLNKKYRLLSHKDTKELEWRDALLTDKMKSMTENMFPASLQMTDSFKKDYVAEQEKNNCATCAGFTQMQLAALRKEIPIPFTARALVQYDLMAYGMGYMALAVFEQCRPQNAATLQANLARADAELKQMGLLTEEKVAPLKKAYAAASAGKNKIDCTPPQLQAAMNATEYRMTRLMDNIAFYHEEEKSTTY